MNTQYESPFGRIELKRYPLFPKSKAQQNLQAWDGADSLLLEELKHSKALERAHNVLILNDQFGALSCGVLSSETEARVVSQSDSFLSQIALRQNLKHNHIAKPIDSIASTDTHPIAPDQHFDLVLMRVPKNLNFLEDQLYALREVIDTNTRIIACSMVKGLSPNTKDLFNTILGPSEQSLASKKARLIHCSADPSKYQGQSSFPKTYSHDGLEFSNFANVFSHASIDPGTRVFVQNIHQLPQSESLIDLACGNGIMGIFTGKHSKVKQCYFVDESHMAIASAKQNAKHLPSGTAADFLCANSIPSEVPTVDLIVCNPPFHQQQTMMTDMAIAMFKDAKKHLNRAGEFWVIANRHLGYHSTLKKLFGNCENMANDKKYVLLRCVNI